MLYSISAITGYLMSNLFLYKYIKYIVSQHILSITILNGPELISFDIVKFFIYFYLIIIILFTIDHFFEHVFMLSSIVF